MNQRDNSSHPIVKALNGLGVAADLLVLKHAPGTPNLPDLCRDTDTPAERIEHRIENIAAHLRAAVAA